MSTVAAKSSLIDELRDFARANIVPVNSTIGLSALLVCALDFCSPVLGPKGLQAIALVGALGAVWLLWTAKSRQPAAGNAWRIMVGVLLACIAVGTTAASTKADRGGWIASASEKARDVQATVFDIRQRVIAVQDGVDQATRVQHLRHVSP